MKRMLDAEEHRINSRDDVGFISQVCLDKPLANTSEVAYREVCHDPTLLDPTPSEHPGY